MKKPEKKEIDYSLGRRDLIHNSCWDKWNKYYDWKMGQLLKIMLEVFPDYLHTVTFAHENQPNEPHQQVLFKRELPEIVKLISKRIREGEKA